MHSEAIMRRFRNAARFAAADGAGTRQAGAARQKRAPFDAPPPGGNLHAHFLARGCRTTVCRPPARPPARQHFRVFDTIHYQRARSVAAPAAPTRAALLPFPASFRGGNRPVCIRNGPAHLLVVVNNGPEHVDHVL